MEAGFQIVSVSTHATPAVEQGDALIQWAEIALIVRKDFNWSKPEALLKKLKAASDLIGAPEP